MEHLTLGGISDGESSSALQLMREMKSDSHFAGRLLNEIRYANSPLSLDSALTRSMSLPVGAEMKDGGYSGPCDDVNVSAPRNMLLWRQKSVAFMKVWLSRSFLWGRERDDLRMESYFAQDIAVTLHVTNKQMTFETEKVLLFRSPFIYRDILAAVSMLSSSHFWNPKTFLFADFIFSFPFELTDEITSDRPFTLSVHFSDKEIEISNEHQFAEAEKATNLWDEECIWRVVVDAEKSTNLMRRLSVAIGKKKEKNEKVTPRERAATPTAIDRTVIVSSSDDSDSLKDKSERTSSDLEADAIDTVPSENVSHPSFFVVDCVDLSLRYSMASPLRSLRISFRILKPQSSYSTRWFAIDHVNSLEFV
jgi:hypothetical protein